MRPFSYLRADHPAMATQAAQSDRVLPATLARTQFLAGGTTLLDLMKLDAMRPEVLIDLNGMRAQLGEIRTGADGLWVGALVSMADAAKNPVIGRDYPVIAQSLQLAASPQLRNMATLGGNVLQRTRCQYFRDPSWPACNKRDPGSGCSALEGVNRKHAVLGTSEHCIATYPGDFAQALMALDARVEITGKDGRRQILFEQLHRLPGDTPERETVLASDDLITGFSVPAGPWTRRSGYIKIRDRTSYDFSLASAAVALAFEASPDSGASPPEVPRIESVRIALGGIATKPWRAHEAEAVLSGRPLTEQVAAAAADAALAGAVTRGGNAFKPQLAKQTLIRALFEVAAL